MSGQSTNDAPMDWGQVINDLKAKHPKKPQKDSVSDDPFDILDTWTILEALSPQSYRTPQKRAADVGGKVHFFSRDDAPWFKRNKPQSPEYKIYYLVNFGAIPLANASRNLSNIYLDEADKPVSHDFAALGSIILDAEGIPLNGFSVASFSWCYGRALQGRLADLAFWHDIEPIIREALNRILYGTEKTNEPTPMMPSQLIQVHEWLIKHCGLPATETTQPNFAIQVERKKTASIQDLSLLNSFYMDDC